MSVGNCFDEMKGPCYQILRSGLLLDEDLAFLLDYYRVPEDEEALQPEFPMARKIIVALSLASTTVCVQLNWPMPTVAISASPMIYVGVQHLRRKIYKLNQMRNIKALLETISATIKLNRIITEYFKLRKASSTNVIIDPLTGILKELIELMAQEEVAFLRSFLRCLHKFGVLVPFLAIDYAHLYNTDLEEYTATNFDNIHDCISYLKKLCDIYVLVASGTLTCLGITLSSRMLVLFKIDVDNVFDTIVSEMKKTSMSCYKKINKKFDDVKYYYLVSYKQVKKPAPSQCSSTSSRLRQGSYNLMTHSSNIIEKSRAILEKLEKYNMDMVSDKQMLREGLCQLRNDVQEYYEALDRVEKLCAMNIRQSMPPTVFFKDPPSDSSSSIVVEEYIEDGSLNPVEPSGDEEYEAYVGPNDVSSEFASTSMCDEEDNRKYAAMLSQELKRKLATHSKFLAAQEKRGVKIDEDAELLDEAAAFAAEPVNVPEPPPPPFQNPRRNLTPPPPPPPLLPLDLDFDEEEVGSPYLVNDFLESLKAMSREVEEDVFIG